MVLYIYFYNKIMNEINMKYSLDETNMKVFSGKIHAKMKINAV